MPRSPAPRTRRRPWTSWPRTSRRSWTRAASSSEDPRGRAARGPGLSPLRHDDMADTLQTSPQASQAPDRLEAPPAARRFRWLTDGWLATLMVSPAMAILIFLSIGPLIWLILLSFTDYSATRDVGYNWVGFENYTDVLTDPVVRERA